jgi:hypothetical protein
MKLLRGTIVIGAIGGLVINTAAGYLLTFYNTFNVVLVDVVIVVGLALFLYLCRESIQTAYKIGLSWVLVATTCINVLLVLFSPPTFKDNYIILLALFLTLVEAVALCVVTMMKKYV